MLLLMLASLSDEQQDIISDIFEKNEKLFFNVAYGYLGNSVDAEDVVSDSLVKIIKNIDKISNIGNTNKIRSFCVTIVKNTSVDLLRKSKQVNSMDESEYINSVQVIDVEDITIKKINHQEILGIIKMMKEDDRKLIYLRYKLNLSYKEIASMLGITESNARKRVQRLIEKIKIMLEEDLYDE